MRLYEFANPAKYLLPKADLPPRLTTIEESQTDRGHGDAKSNVTRKQNLREKRPSHSSNEFNRY
jgi:hypothetical protein